MLVMRTKGLFATYNEIKGLLLNNPQYYNTYNYDPKKSKYISKASILSFL